MTDSNNSLNELPALIDERRQYEGWLAALDARRESTPRHVFERVQADYKTRLQRVAERLASHRSVIERNGRAFSRASRCSRPKSSCAATSGPSSSFGHTSGSWSARRRIALSAESTR